MSKVNGRLVTCDRCGVEVFNKHIKDEHTDGGYTSYNVFEQLPEGWKTYLELSADLCPTCSDAWLRIKAQFMEEA